MAITSLQVLTRSRVRHSHNFVKDASLVEERESEAAMVLTNLGAEGARARRSGFDLPQVVLQAVPTPIILKSCLKTASCVNGDRSEEAFGARLIGARDNEVCVVLPIT